MSKPKQDDDTVAAARSFLQQFAGLQQLASMVDEVAGLRDELASLREQRQAALNELNVLFGERDAELKVLTQQIEDRVRGEHEEGERLHKQAADMRAAIADLSEDVQDRRKKLTSLEQAIMRAEGQYGAINEKLAQLRGAIPQGT